jgi:uncharacterized repeat protein (TIGR03803 family)
MRIVSRGMAITIAALSFAGSASAAPVETVLYTFAGASDGHVPFAGLIANEQGTLYGTTNAGGIGNNGTVFKLTPPPKGQTGWTETVLYSFCSQPSCSDGAAPLAGLIADERGALYGTTSGGGGSGGYGTVFKLTPPPKGQTAWTETVLHSFARGSDGGGPYAGLIADKQAALYGTTAAGGTGSNGTVFKLTPPPKGQTAWTPAVLYSFCSQPSCSDGAAPFAGLIADKRGALYSTTNFGGSGTNGGYGVPYGGGTVFKLTPPPKGQTTWKETVLYSFCSLSSCADGINPYASLIADGKGALYSTTSSGGVSSAVPCCYGTVFKLTP